MTGSCTLRRRLSKSVTFLFWILPCSCHCQPIETIGFVATCAAYLTVISEAQAMHVAARVRLMFLCSRGVHGRGSCLDITRHTYVGETDALELLSKTAIIDDDSP